MQKHPWALWACNKKALSDKGAGITDEGFDNMNTAWKLMYKTKSVVQQASMAIMSSDKREERAF